MTHVVTPENEYHYRDEMEQAYRLRHQVFVEEMGWTDLAKPDGRETDQFDDKHVMHMLYIEEGKVLGYQRMLPSTRPHLLSDVMPELCEVERPVGPHVWEWTRYCVVQGHRDRGRALSPIGNALLSGIVEWRLYSGISTIIIEMTTAGSASFPDDAARPATFDWGGGEDTIAVMATFDWRTLNRLREMRGTRKMVLAEALEKPVQAGNVSYMAFLYRGLLGGGTRKRGPPPVSKLIMKSCTRRKIRTANRPQAAFAI